MRSSVHPKLVSGRIRSGTYASDDRYGNSGAFEVASPRSGTLRIIANDSDVCPDGWEHVSVSMQNRCPNWDEMCFVKDLFWNEDEIAYQLHPAKKDYVNYHPYCLHLWRNKNQDPLLPPSIYVGPSTK